MAELDENKVRNLAYQLWEQNGRQDGMDDEYWHAAEKLLADEGDEAEADDGSVAAPVVPLAPLAAIVKPK